MMRLSLLPNRLWGSPQLRCAVLVVEFASITAQSSFRTVCKVIGTVIDTNVLVSALLSPEGNAALIVQAVKAGLISLFLTDEIADEYAAVLKRPKLDFAPDVTSGILDMIRMQATVVQPDRSASASPDQGDTKFLQCALAARADAIITGNQRDIRMDLMAQRRFFSISAFLERLTDAKR